MYTQAATAAVMPFAAFGDASPPETPTLDCPNCGEGFTPRSKNQRYCSGICNREDRTRERQRRRQQAEPIKRNCTWCGGSYEPIREDHDFCKTSCQQAFNNWAKGWGARVVKTLLAWRFRGRRIGLTDVCRMVVDLHDDLKRKRRAAKGEGS